MPIFYDYKLTDKGDKELEFINNNDSSLSNFEKDILMSTAISDGKPTSIMDDLGIEFGYGEIFLRNSLLKELSDLAEKGYLRAIPDTTFFRSNESITTLDLGRIIEQGKQEE